MSKTLTLRLDSEQSVMIDELCEDNNIKASSKMVMHCVSKYRSNRDSMARMSDRIAELEHREAVLSEIIESARAACAIVVDRTAQQELLG